MRCSNASCPGEGWFHPECTGAQWENVNKDDDFFCSIACKKSGNSKLCHCKKTANQTEMVMCEAGLNCKYGIWFHFKCIDMSEDDIPGKMYNNLVQNQEDTM